MLDDFICDFTAEDSYRYYTLDEETIEWIFLEQNGIEAECYED